MFRTVLRSERSSWSQARRAIAAEISLLSCSIALRPLPLSSSSSILYLSLYAVLDATVFGLFSTDSITEDFNLSVGKLSWPLSSYGPSKYAPTFIGGLDISPEELRVKAVMAKINGTGNEYVCSLIRFFLLSH
jgi:hypothetical protein